MKERILEEFDEKTNLSNFEEGRKLVGEHLFDPNMYPESPYELDRDKIKDWLSQSLDVYAREVLAKIMPQKEVNLSSADSDIYNEGVADGYFACFSQIKSKARELEIIE